MSVKLTNLVDLGSDVLAAFGVDDDGNEHVAFGWVSATSNHFDPDAYLEDGSRRDDARPRKMTEQEVGVYATGLLNPPSPVPVPFST